MNQNVVEFLLIFCLISAVACLVVLVVAASAQPPETITAVIFAVGGVAFGAAASQLNKKRKAEL